MVAADHPVYENRQRAESFGAVANLYDRARPSYPPQLIDALLIDEPRRIVDVGCGTGIAAALLAVRGCSVVGVEADERMAGVARAKGIDVEVSAFETWEPAGRMFDLVTAAQSWHWVNPTLGSAKAAAVLRPGGRIGVFWNFADPPHQVRELLTPVYQRLEPRLAANSVVLGNRTSRAETTTSELARCGNFAPASTATFTWTKLYDTTGWLEQLRTHSDHQTLPPRRRERLLEAVGEALEAIGGSLAMRYHTVLVTAVRR